MPASQYHVTPQGRRLAFKQTRARDAAARPGVVFLGGFRSDMTGTKAEYLEEFVTKKGLSFLRFDYSGHGVSDGTFEEGCIGDWAEDAAELIGERTDGPQLLVGSSMGGWIALLLAKRMAPRVAGLIGIAAAPDFTQDSMWAGFDSDQRATLVREGQLSVPSEYSDAPYVITKRLIEDGRDHLVLRDPLPLPFPVRLLHGTADADVALSVPLRLIEHASCPDMRLTLVKDEDHRFSSDTALDLLGRTLSDMIEAAQ
ncbi:MAG: alpha/beta hydrolase [Pseudomonadota bacterium]